MSASISWRPVSQGKVLDLTAPQSFMRMLERGLDIPTVRGARLTRSQIPLLKAMLATQEQFDYACGPATGFRDLIEALEKHGSIVLDVTY
jgi:hypothetical protein